MKGAQSTATQNKQNSCTRLGYCNIQIEKLHQTPKDVVAVQQPNAGSKEFLKVLRTCQQEHAAHSNNL